MFHRTVNLPKSRSFFLFGARGTGKSTLLKHVFDPQNTITFDLLNPNLEEQFVRNPMELESQVLQLPGSVTHVIIDEVQKAPKLLDVVHKLIENKKVSQAFILTGSSARKLKLGGANLLAGRAALRHLYSLTSAELANQFDLTTALNWGSLPYVWNTSDTEARFDYLRAYAQLYLKEEIWAEQFVRRLDPFRRFTEIAAKNSGKILNFANISKDVGVDFKTIQQWYLLLEETLIGFHLDAFHSSIRKQLRQAPKFYFFDCGIARALGHMLNVKVQPQTSYFGDTFEQLVISEIFAKNSYENLEYQMNYLQTKSGVEIDLILTRPGKPMALLEIKSKTQIQESDAASLNHFATDFPNADFYLLSCDKTPKKIGKTQAVHWQDGLLMI